MLDEAEFAEVYALYVAGIRRTQDFREAHGLSLPETPTDEFFRPMRERYEAITGFHEPNQLAILHHRIESYGPPCGSCGKPLRTPKAKLCAACGKDVV